MSLVWFCVIEEIRVVAVGFFFLCLGFDFRELWKCVKYENRRYVSGNCSICESWFNLMNKISVSFLEDRLRKYLGECLDWDIKDKWEFGK